MILLMQSFSCHQNSQENFKKPITEGISIFEIYLEDSVAVNNFSDLLRNTLKLPVEWEPFDIFGNNVVYDAAFHLGNTTLELLSVNPPDSNITTKAKYNRIIFNSNDIESTRSKLKNLDIISQPPFDFQIASNNSELVIGKQINLDSISLLSNINIAFWQYRSEGYNFTERTIKGETILSLNSKLEEAMISNPMGIIGLKEIHLTLTERATKKWVKLFGPSEDDRWELLNGPTISYTKSSNSDGVDWIKLNVANLDIAKYFLIGENLMLKEGNRILIDPSKIYGLRIYVEE